MIAAILLSWLILSVPAALIIGKFCALSNDAPTPPQVKHEQTQTEHAVRLLHS